MARMMWISLGVWLMTAGQLPAASPASDFLVNATTPTLERLKQPAFVFTSDADRLHTTPTYVIEADQDGKPRIAVVAPLIDTDPWKLDVYVLVNPESLLDEVAVEVNKWATGLPLDHAYKYCEHIDRRHLLQVEITSLTVEEITPRGRAAIFQPYESHEFGVPKQIVLSAYFDSAESAQAMAERIRNDGAHVRFRVRCSYRARHTNAASAVRVTMTDVNKSEAIVELNGSGRPFFAGVDGDQRKIKLGDDSVVVTRKQMQRLEGEIVQQVSERYQIDDPAHLAVLSQRVESHLEQQLPKQSFAMEELGAMSRNLSAYGFNPKDLSPDLIQKVAYEQREVLQTDDSTRLRTKLEASAGFLGLFNAGAGHENDRESIRRRMEDAGWRFGTDGEYWVPKSLEVYVGNINDISFKRDILIQLNSGSLGEQLIETEVSTANGFSPRAIDQELLSSKQKHLSSATESANTLATTIQTRSSLLDQVLNELNTINDAHREIRNLAVDISFKSHMEGVFVHIQKVWNWQPPGGIPHQMNEFWLLGVHDPNRPDIRREQIHQDRIRRVKELEDMIAASLKHIDELKTQAQTLDQSIQETHGKYASERKEIEKVDKKIEAILNY